MKTYRLLGIGVAAGVALFSAAAAANFASILWHGHRYQVRAVKVGSEWYLDARDVAGVVGGGAFFDSHSRTLYSTIPARAARARALPGEPLTSNGSLGAHIVSLSRPATVKEIAADPGTHFVAALIEMKNMSAEAQPLYDSTVRIMSGSTHINEGQLYEANYADIAQAATPAHSTHRYLVVFEVPDDAAPDIILVHPNFGNGPDLILHIKM